MFGDEIDKSDILVRRKERKKGRREKERSECGLMFYLIPSYFYSIFSRLLSILLLLIPPIFCGDHFLERKRRIKERREKNRKE